MFMTSSLWVAARRVLAGPSCWGDAVGAYFCATWDSLEIRPHELCTACLVTKARRQGAVSQGEI